MQCGVEGDSCDRKIEPGFSELLAYNEEETRRWKEWFAQNPTALELPLDIADASNVRGLLLHIFLVEVHFAHIILGLDRVSIRSWHVFHG